MKHILVLLMLCASASNAQLKIQTTNSFAVVGGTIGMVTNADTSAKSIMYYLDSVKIAVVSNNQSFLHIVTNEGLHKLYAIQTFPTFKMSDTVAVFFASRTEFARIALEEIKYAFTKKVFPDSSIVLPQAVIILGYTHSTTTLKTTLNYLNPRF